MNLADSSFDELLKIQEVGLVLIDYANNLVLDNVNLFDTILFSNFEFRVKKIQNSICLQTCRKTNGGMSYNNILSANCDPIYDKREWSTRVSNNTSRYVIRNNSDNNSVLVVNQIDWFYITTQGNELYLEHLTCTDEESFTSEVFQKSLIYSEMEMNSIILNFLLNKTLPIDGSIVLCGYTYEVGFILDFHKYLDELKDICYNVNSN